MFSPCGRGQLDRNGCAAVGGSAFGVRSRRGRGVSRENESLGPNSPSARTPLFDIPTTGAVQPFPGLIESEENRAELPEPKEVPLKMNLSRAAKKFREQTPRKAEAPKPADAKKSQTPAAPAPEPVPQPAEPVEPTPEPAATAPAEVVEVAEPTPPAQPKTA